MRKTRTFLCSMQLVDGACDERPDASLDEVVVNITSAPLAGNGISQAEYYYNDDEEHRDFSCQRECGERLGSINTSSAQETVLDSRSKARVFMTSGYDLVPASESTSSPLVCSLFVFDCMGASVRVAMYNEDDRQFHALKAIRGHGNTLCRAWQKHRTAEGTISSGNNPASQFLCHMHADA